MQKLRREDLWDKSICGLYAREKIRMGVITFENESNETNINHFISLYSINISYHG